jgi:hypothetical protein
MTDLPELPKVFVVEAEFSLQQKQELAQVFRQVGKPETEEDKAQ